MAVGIPFPKGYLTDPTRVRLLDASGKPVRLQCAPLARWSDGSVKWLLLDFLVPGVQRGQVPWILDCGATAEPRAPFTEELRIQESPRTIEVDTGAATFQVSRTHLGPLERVLIRGKEILAGSQVRMTGPMGRVGRVRLERAVLEARGPVRSTIRLEGRWTGAVRCRFLARLCFFAGTGLVRVRLTIHNPNRARHPGGLWDLGDPGSVFFRDLSLELSAADKTGIVTWVAEAGQSLRIAGDGLEIYQGSSGGEKWRSRAHANRNGRVPCAFRGYQVHTSSGQATGLRASPIVNHCDQAGQLSAAVPEFWQQFPKAIEADSAGVRLRLFPRQYQDLFELQGGEQKTHLVWLDFGADAEALGWVHRPALVHAGPEWYAAAGVFPHFDPGPGGTSEHLTPLLAEAVGGGNSFFAKREIIDEYGWRNYGEVYADHEAAYYVGPPPVISHYNNQYDLIDSTLRQYLRTGDARWIQLADPLARHVIDIDIYHTNRDKAAYNGGLFWHTDHYKDAATCTHRTYSRQNSPLDNRGYGGGPGSCHNYTTGLLHYHYLTGDPLAAAAVQGLADWAIAMDDGAQHPFGLIDPGPTGLASETGGGDYHGPGRGAGWSMNALLDGWSLTGRRAYLDKAEELIRRCVHPNDDIDSRALLDAERRWSYTIFFSVLARYLDLKTEAGALDANYAYARTSLAAYAGWMVANEVPYLDRPERLEYPTEVWAAQELRKANVLRLAAAYVEEPLRFRLVQRGNELADRGWHDLARLESRTNSRALAVVLAEGPRDAYFRAHAMATVPPAPTGHDFGQPTPFHSQKARVRAQLRRARGLARALGGLANVRGWYRLWRGRAAAIEPPG